MLDYLIWYISGGNFAIYGLKSCKIFIWQNSTKISEIFQLVTIASWTQDGIIKYLNGHREIDNHLTTHLYPIYTHFIFCYILETKKKIDQVGNLSNQIHVPQWLAILFFKNIYYVTCQLYISHLYDILGDILPGALR